MRKISVLAILLSVGIGSAATAAQNTVVPHTDEMVEINGTSYPTTSMRCSVNGRTGAIYTISGLTPAAQQWYRQNGRIIDCVGAADNVVDCYCFLGADCSVGDTCGSRYAGETEYCSSYTTPRALMGRIVSPNTQNVGVPCNEIGVTCKCEVEKCEGFMEPNQDGTCPELPDETETQPDQESSDSATENPCSNPYDVPDRRGVCRPLGGYIDADRGGYRYAGRQCTGETLTGYQPKATKGYWTQTVHGRHNCPEVGGSQSTGPYVQCGCGATKCESGYTAHLGNCYTNADYQRIISARSANSGTPASQSANPYDPAVVELQELSGVEATVDAAQVPFDQEVQYLYRDCKTDIITQGNWIPRDDELLWCAPGNKCIDKDTSVMVDCCCEAEVCADPYHAVGKYCIPATDYRQNMVGELDDCLDESGSEGWYMPVDRFTKETDDVVPCVSPNSDDNEPYIIGECYCYNPDYRDDDPEIKEATVSISDYTDSAPEIKGATVSIPDLVANLSKIESEFGLSKWRTVDGKFNYARLASDATAGVVLGTTGALVTASVVKKKQVEDGFESLECTVGGQHVGDWGDVFRIDGK